MVNIYGTVGPSCSNAGTLEAMFREGMTGLRLNLSHTSLRDAGDLITHIHVAANRVQRRALLLIDMQGPELRVGRMRDVLDLADGAAVILAPCAACADRGGCSVAGNNAVIPIPGICFPHLDEGRELLLDDGKIMLRVTRGHDDFAEACVVRGGRLCSEKSIAVAGAHIDAPAVTDADMRNLADAAEFGVTAVMQPFVRGREDLDAVRSEMNKCGLKDAVLMAKVENTDGIEHLPELIAGSDEIVIARGDLGNAMPLWELPAVQKRIARACREAGRRFMVVTQMLASMENSAVPTRAEVSDIFNAVLDGASSVMVTGETAVGRYPAETIRYLAKTAAEAEKYAERFGG